MTLRKTRLRTQDIVAFERSFDGLREAKATASRGEFLEAFPLSTLKDLKKEDYVIGLKSPTFCTHVEAKTSAWARIQGSTAYKFGMYYGKVSSDPVSRYRVVKRFSAESDDDSFALIKSALIDLVANGQAENPDFELLDANPLSQLFKAKILSLYFPDRFINICSATHLTELADMFGYPVDRPVSEYQHRLLRLKATNRRTREWSNPKFMEFLYRYYLRADQKGVESIQRLQKKAPHSVDFELIQAERDEIGRKAEAYAFDYEKRRLKGAGLDALIKDIEDLRDKPKYGYDFLSHSSRRDKRYIEVKAVGKLPKAAGYRFFLSSNQYDVSTSVDRGAHYYFYLVHFDSAKEPFDLTVISAVELYKNSDMTPVAFQLSFDVGSK